MKSEVLQLPNKKENKRGCLLLLPGVYQMSVSEAAVPGEEVGRVKAKDPDIGENGLVTYNIVDGDGMELFEITTDYETQEGVVKLKKVRQDEESDMSWCELHRESSPMGDGKLKVKK
jgi:hypothetical protein